MRSIFSVLVSLLVLSASAEGQFCTGNLGDNIFTAGDFGSGAPNIVPVNPMIAPGYNYVTNPPPNDGSYTVTNNIAVWPQNFGWLTIGDNSPDPQGYMMVVNASFSPGLFYEQVVTGLCENTLYQFTADIINLIRANGNMIKPEVSFLINGTPFYSTGQIPENEQWVTYGFSFTTQPGQTSLTLALQNSAPGGNGNDIALDNIEFRPCGPEAKILPDQSTLLCIGSAPFDLNADIIGTQYSTPNFQWQQSFDMGVTWVDIPGANTNLFTHTPSTAGTFYYRYLLANDPNNLVNSKCRVISSVKVVEVQELSFNLTDTLCDGDTYPFGSMTLSSTGIYTDTLASTLGCDSIIILDLTVLPDPVISGIFEVNDPPCYDSQEGSIQLDTVLNGYPPYNYFLDGSPLPNGTDVLNLPAGAYTYGIVDRWGCSFETTLNLVQPLPFSIDLEPDWEINLGDSIEVIATSNYPIAQYTWNSVGTVDCDTACSPLSWLPPASGYLTLIGTNENGCEATDSVYIEVTVKRKVYIPNAFSPNGDGLNDYFTIQGDFPGALQVDNLTIFDRWGGRVFQRTNFPVNDMTQGWDGNSDGKSVPEGVYPFVAQVRFLDEEVLVYSGTITLVR